jgi:hypothetical protein
MSSGRSWRAIAGLDNPEAASRAQRASVPCSLESHVAGTLTNMPSSGALVDRIVLDVAASAVMCAP